MKNGKAPGPDGITAKFYKTCQEEIIEPFLDIVNEIMKGGKIPQSWQEASISLIPKEMQDLTNVKNYRPISLLNNDYKIFAKIIAERLKKYLSEVIAEDQAGFLPNRQIKDNLRMVINAIEYYEKQPGTQVAFFFVDAEKAFDNLNWNFMFKLMEKLDLGENFIKSIKAIYTEQKANLIVNTDVTENFRVEKGTRQGCPLSPLLFVMVLEVLLSQIRDDDEIMGLKLKGFKYKYRAFADDVMFILEDPLNTTMKLLDKIQIFGNLAGFYLNKAKSKVMCKNMTKTQKQELAEKTDCEVVQRFKYLGVEITMKNVDLYKNNYEKLWSQIEKEMISWNKWNFSLMGRISVIKMNVLPRVMFLLQTIPIVNNMKIFEKWQKRVSEFIWEGRKPRIKMKVLCDVRERGGMRLPNFRLYHEAVCLSWVKDWVTLSNRRLLNLEGYGNWFGWHAYLMYDKKKVDGGFMQHSLRRTLFAVWNKYSKYLNIKRPTWIVPVEVLSPITQLQGKDWITYKELLEYTNNQFKLRGQEETVYKEDWFKYRQIRDLFLTDMKKYGFRNENDEIEEILLGNKEKLISKLYKYVLKWFTVDEIVKVQMVKWAININKEIMMEAWEHLWLKSMKISCCNNVNENVYKMMYRWYLTPKKIANMKLDKHYSNKCWKCQDHEGSFYHMWWTCDKAKLFWALIHKEICKVLCHNIEKKPEMFLIGLHMEKLPVIERKIVWYMLTAARLCYAQLWKQNTIPDMDMWLKKMLYMVEMDKLTRLVKDEDLELFFEDWKLFKNYLDKHWKLKNLIWIMEEYL